MSTWRELAARAAGLLWRRTPDRDLDDEVQFHLEMLSEDYRRRGLEPRQARLAAVRHFGGVTQMKEAYRDQRGLPPVETFVQDVRYGIRSLARTPGFVLAALLTLALGIGANTAIFSVVHAVLLRPLPYPEPDRIMSLMRRYPSGEWGGHTGRRFMAFRDHLRGAEAIAAWRNPTGINLAIGDTAEFVRAMSVSKEYFDVFGVQPAIGQRFASEHDTPGGPAVAILADALWRRHFAADPQVIGRTISLGDQAFTVVGVMPPTFSPLLAADLLVPLRPDTTGPGGGYNYQVAARARPGVSPGQLTAEAQAVWESLRREVPQEFGRTELPSRFIRLQEAVAAPLRPALLLMIGAVGLLLVLACANTANLLLARAAGRGREIAVRAALGAGRARLVRQLLTESVLLAMGGAALGVLLAYWSVPALLALAPPGFTLNQDVRIDATVLGVTFGVALATGLLFGLAPALSLSRHDLVEVFKDDSTRSTGGRRSVWLRKTLVVAEVALCMVLLIGAGLLMKTFVGMRAIDPGFDARGVLTAQMSLQGERYADPQDLNRFFEQGLERIRSIPGVRSAAVVNAVPIASGLNLNVDVVDGPETDRVVRALTDWRYASTGYFETMGIQIVAGRGFEEQDRPGAPPVTVVNEEFARRFFNETPAVGRHLRVFETDLPIRIVGIAKNVREQGLVGDLPAVMFVPVAQASARAIEISHQYFSMNWVVRADNPGPGLIREIREQIAALDPRQPFSAFRTMEDIKDAQIAPQRFQMTLLAVLAGIGLALAAAGIYGLMAYSVAQRTREFGIRVALGATSSAILQAVLWNGTLLAVAGVAIGTGAALTFTRTLQEFVWGVSTLDPVTFVAVAVILIVVAGVASLVPAFRAIRLNPVTALRD